MQKNKSLTHRNRGKFLESLIDNANVIYKRMGVADVDKIPTALQITKDNGSNVIARKEKAKWVDYVGVTDKKTVIFDAKETKGKSFPLANLKEHQYQKMKSWWFLGHEAFLVVNFSEEKEIYRLPFEIIHNYYERYLLGMSPKSINIKAFKEHGKLLAPGEGMALDYLNGLY